MVIDRAGCDGHAAHKATAWSSTPVQGHAADAAEPAGWLPRVHIAELADHRLGTWIAGFGGFSV